MNGPSEWCGPPQKNPRTTNDLCALRQTNEVLTYSQADARRLANIRRQPRVSPSLDSNGGTGIVVLAGTAEILDDYPAMPRNPAWLEKYGEAIDARFGSAAKFAERFSIPVRIHLTRVRSF